MQVKKSVKVTHLVFWQFVLFSAAGANAQEEPARASADICAPCLELMDNFRARRQASAESSDSEKRLPLLYVSGSITLDKAKEANGLAIDCLNKKLQYRRETGKVDPCCMIIDREIDDFVRRVQGVLVQFSSVSSEREALSNVTTELRIELKALVQKIKLPPRELCADCKALELSLVDLLDISTAVHVLSKIKLHRASQAAAALEEYSALKLQLCERRRKILDFNAEQMEHDFRYFTWTDTWSGIEAVRGILNDRVAESLCG